MDIISNIFTFNQKLYPLSNKAKDIVSNNNNDSGFSKYNVWGSSIYGIKSMGVWVSTKKCWGRRV